MGECRRGEEEDAIDDEPAPVVTRAKAPAPPTPPATERAKEGKRGGSGGGARSSFPPRNARSPAAGVHPPTAATGGGALCTPRPSRVQRAVAPCRRPRQRTSTGWGMANAVAVAAAVAVGVALVVRASAAAAAPTATRSRGGAAAAPGDRGLPTPLFPKFSPPLPSRRAGRPTWSPAGRSRRRLPPPCAPNNTFNGA